MKQINSLFAIFFLSMATLISACEKGYLEVKPDKSLLVPKTLADMQALLDDTDLMNDFPALPTLASDDYYTTDAGLKSYRSAPERNSYLWKAEVYEGARVFDWNTPYEQIFKANVVLDGLKTIPVTDKNHNEWNRIKGSALFYRGVAIYNLAQSFAAPYTAQTGSMPGIPLKLSSDINERPGRTTLKKTYDQLIADISEAGPLLPVKSALLNRPSRWAANAMLARIYLSMGEYEKAGSYANASLEIGKELIDFNTLNPGGVRPITFSTGSKEIIFLQYMIGLSSLSSTLTMVDSNVVKSFGSNDLRRVVFLRDRGKGVINFKGNYNGTSIVFAGPATDEMYLIRAESRARLGDVNGSMDDLNTLLEQRWKRGTFTKLAAADGKEALKLVLQERRKELLSRGTRWSDLRRLNTDPSFAVTLKRAIDGVTYILSPGDNRYVFPIPTDELLLNPMVQNPR